MGFLSRGELGRGPFNIRRDPEEYTCFFCGTSVHDPAQLWIGCIAVIHLHPVCAVDLAIRLLNDFHALQKLTGRRYMDPPWRDLSRSRDPS